VSPSMVVIAVKGRPVDGNHLRMENNSKIN
jgi:hypothetical protein